MEGDCVPLLLHKLVHNAENNQCGQGRIACSQTDQCAGGVVLTTEPNSGTLDQRAARSGREVCTNLQPSDRRNPDLQLLLRPAPQSLAWRAVTAGVGWRDRSPAA
jgi:hypothetical protein